MITVDWHSLIPEAHIYAAFGIIVTVLGIVVKYSTRRLITNLKAEWADVKGSLGRIENVQGVQAENHLCHIQESTTKSNEILLKLQLEAAETNGYLRAITNEYLKDISNKKS